MTEVIQTYDCEGIRVSRLGSGLFGSECYMLSSSECTVEPLELHQLFLANQPEEHTGQAVQSGRGHVRVFEHNAKSMVLRRYRRGGLISRWLKSHYLWTGLRNSRPFRELSLLNYLQSQAVPACKPFAAMVQRRFAVYSASLITFEVAESETLGNLLREGRVEDRHWQPVGEAIRKMHDLGVWHADLNAHNILLSGDRAVLIDFDRGQLKAKHLSNWKQANLYRLARSFEKLKNRYGFEFGQQQWEALKAAYANRKGA